MTFMSPEPSMPQDLVVAKLRRAFLNLREAPMPAPIPCQPPVSFNGPSTSVHDDGAPIVVLPSPASAGDQTCQTSRPGQPPTDPGS